MKVPVKFKYALPYPGIANMMIEVNGSSADFEFSNTTDPLTDLFRGMVSMIFEPSHIWDEENIHWIEWYGESGSQKWMFSTADGNIINIRVDEYEDLFDDLTRETRISERCGLYDFYHAIIMELDRFIKLTGLLNYEQRWQKEEFPVTYFLLFKKYLIERGLWSATPVSSEVLNNEIDILFLCLRLGVNMFCRIILYIYH